MYVGSQSAPWQHHGGTGASQPGSQEWVAFSSSQEQPRTVAVGTSGLNGASVKGGVHAATGVKPFSQLVHNQRPGSAQFKQTLSLPGAGQQVSMRVPSPQLQMPAPAPLSQPQLPSASQYMYMSQTSMLESTSEVLVPSIAAAPGRQHGGTSMLMPSSSYAPPGNRPQSGNTRTQTSLGLGLPTQQRPASVNSNMDAAGAAPRGRPVSAPDALQTAAGSQAMTQTGQMHLGRALAQDAELKRACTALDTLQGQMTSLHQAHSTLSSSLAGVAAAIQHLPALSLQYTNLSTTLTDMQQMLSSHVHETRQLQASTGAQQSMREVLKVHDAEVQTSPAGMGMPAGTCVQQVYMLTGATKRLSMKVTRSYVVEEECIEEVEEVGMLRVAQVAGGGLEGGVGSGNADMGASEPLVQPDKNGSAADHIDRTAQQQKHRLWIEMMQDDEDQEQQQQQQQQQRVEHDTDAIMVHSNGYAAPAAAAVAPAIVAQQPAGKTAPKGEGWIQRKKGGPTAPSSKPSNASPLVQGGTSSAAAAAAAAAAGQQGHKGNAVNEAGGKARHALGDINAQRNMGMLAAGIDKPLAKQPAAGLLPQKRQEAGGSVRKPAAAAGIEKRAASQSAVGVGGLLADSGRRHSRLLLPASQAVGKHTTPPGNVFSRKQAGAAASQHTRPAAATRVRDHQHGDGADGKARAASQPQPFAHAPAARKPMTNMQPIGGSRAWMQSSGAAKGRSSVVTVSAFLSGCSGSEDKGEQQHTLPGGTPATAAAQSGSMWSMEEEDELARQVAERMQRHRMKRMRRLM